MPQYKHTQIGYLMLAMILFAAIFLFWISSIIPPENKSTLDPVFMTIIILLLLSFATLQTKIDEKYIRIKFGYGIFQRKFLLEKITSARAVKNRWYYGWGVRLWLWPYMWIYNVSGFDAVELKMENGRVYRIGTDVPQELESEINKRLNNQQIAII